MDISDVLKEIFNDMLKKNNKTPISDLILELDHVSL